MGDETGGMQAQSSPILGVKVVRDLDILKLVLVNRKSQGLTRRGMPLIIISWTLFDKLALLEKLTRYFREKVSDTCWFISMTTEVGDEIKCSESGPPSASSCDQLLSLQ